VPDDWSYLCFLLILMLHRKIKMIVKLTCRNDRKPFIPTFIPFNTLKVERVDSEASIIAAMICGSTRAVHPSDIVIRLKREVGKYIHPDLVGSFRDLAIDIKTLIVCERTSRMCYMDSEAKPKTIAYETMQTLADMLSEQKDEESLE